MDANKLYAQLEKDFILPNLSDDWAPHMDEVAVFLCESFQRRSMGLVCDFTDEVNRVFTAVFPSSLVMKQIISADVKEAMLFVHHPSIWDIRKAPQVFQQMNKTLLTEFKNRQISIYNLHVPLDNYGPYSTSVSLARALGIVPEKSFAPYFGSMCGVFGHTDDRTVSDLKQRFEKAVGHPVSLYEYGDKSIEAGRVAIIAGGGNDVEMLKQVQVAGINTYVTGITAKNEHSRQAHEFAAKNRINILGGTHYSTEKFACMAMVGYFDKLGLPAKFIDDLPVMEDM